MTDDHKPSMFGPSLRHFRAKRVGIGFGERCRRPVVNRQRGLPTVAGWPTAAIADCSRAGSSS